MPFSYLNWLTMERRSLIIMNVNDPIVQLALFHGVSQSGLSALIS